jgi:hypothetical protein
MCSDLLGPIEVEVEIMWILIHVGLGDNNGAVFDRSFHRSTSRVWQDLFCQENVRGIETLVDTPTPENFSSTLV